jgi:hypothetical protein
MDLSVAAENATLLRDLMQTVETPADISADPVVGSLLHRCRGLQNGVQRVIQKIQDESVMAAALQVLLCKWHIPCGYFMPFIPCGCIPFFKRLRTEIHPKDKKKASQKQWQQICDSCGCMTDCEALPELLMLFNQFFLFVV